MQLCYVNRFGNVRRIVYHLLKDGAIGEDIVQEKDASEFESAEL